MIKKVLGAAMAAVLAFTAVTPVRAEAPDNTVPKPPPMILQYDEPASQTDSSETWKRATLPIGNGIIGANVYGELKREHLTVNEETLWSGGRGSVPDYNGGNPSESKVAIYNDYANQLLNGAVPENIEGLAGVAQSQSGYNNGYQALGDLYFDVAGAPSSTPSDYRRALDLDQGLATVSYGDATRTYFVSNPDNVLVSRFEGSNIGLTVSFSSKQKASSSASVTGGIGYITTAGTVSNNGLMHNTQIAVVASGGSVSAGSGSVTVSGASDVTVYLTSATDYKNTFWDDTHKIEYYYRTGETDAQLNSRVRRVLDAAVNKGYNAVYQDHETDYTSLYDRVKLDLGQSSSRMTDDLLTHYQSGSVTTAEQRYLEVLMFQYGRYLLISGSRENSQLPTNLQGIWNDSNAAPWYSDIHTNINEQMNYWLSGNCNLTECALPLVKYIADLEIPGHRTVEIYTGSSHGIMAHTQNTPFGYTSPGWTIGTWGWSPAASTWLMQNCFDYYEFSGDVDTLRNVIYPYLKDQVLMYKDLLKSYNGRLVMPITQSPEINIITAGNTYEQSLIWQLFSDTIEAAGILGVDADLVSGWQNIMDQLNPIEIGDSGQIKEWYQETTINSVSNTSSHRHLSNMLGLFPGNLIDTEEELAAAVVSLNNKNFGRIGTSSNPEGGWTYGQLINSWARVFNGENAYYSIQQMLKNRVFNNLWDYHNPTHFQIDANYGYSAGVGEMLVQSNLGYINFLPAIPSVWANGSVDGLLCEGNFAVSMNWTDGSMTSGTITSGKGGACSVKLQPGMFLKDASGNIVGRYNMENPVVTVNTKVGDVLTVESSKLRVTAERAWDGSVTLNWNAKPDESYSISADGEVLASGITSGTYTDEDASAEAVTYTVSCLGDEAAASVTAIITGMIPVQHYTYDLVTTNTLEDGTYLILSAQTNNRYNAIDADRNPRLVVDYISGDKVSEFDGIGTYEWEIKNVSGGITVRSISSGSYLQMSSQDTTVATVSSNPVTLNFVANNNYTNAHGIYNPSSQAYLNYRSNGMWHAGTWNVNGQYSAWYLYKKTPVEIAEYKKTPVTSLADDADGIYVITGSNADNTNKSLDKAIQSSLVMHDISDYISGDIVNGLPNIETYEWEIKAVPNTSYYTVRSLQTQKYLEMSNPNVTVSSVSDNPVNLTIVQGNKTGSVYIRNIETGAYLNYRNANAGTWTGTGDGSSFYLYRKQNVDPVFTISADVLASAEAELGEQNEVLNAARGNFSTLKEAESAYQALVAAITGTTCKHENTTVNGALAATCTIPGSTGETTCTACGKVVKENSEIPALGHEPASEHTDVLIPTCTEAGYTGNLLCARCDDIIERGTTVPVLGHDYMNGICTRCSEAKPDKGLVEVSAGRGHIVKISLTGTFTDLLDIDSYSITEQGFVLMESSKLGGQELMVNTPSRTKVVVLNMGTDGTWHYTFSPKTQTMEYTVRSFVCANGMFIYSEPITLTYKGLPKG